MPSSVRDEAIDQLFGKIVRQEASRDTFYNVCRRQTR